MNQGEIPFLSSQGLEERLRYKPLWDRNIKGQGTTVAVLDTGFQPGTGFDSLVVAEKDFTGEGTPRAVEYKHGTSVATGIHFIAPEAHIANFKVLPGGAEPLRRETVRRAIEHCVESFPVYPIINLSLYFLPETCSKSRRCELCRAVNEAVGKGIVVVAAAGNLGPAPGTITCPALADEALAVVSTWTKNEAEWWESLSRLKKLWWKDISGKLGKAFGTSFSAAWASGGIALLKSAFPESRPEEIRQAVIQSARSLPKAPDIAGMLQCEEALNYLLHPSRYEYAKRGLYFNAGNRDAQPGEPFRHDVGLVLSYIEHKLIAESKVAEAAQELSEVKGWLIPDLLPDYRAKIDSLLARCESPTKTIA